MAMTLYIFFGKRPWFITAPDFGNDLLIACYIQGFFSLLKYSLEQNPDIKKSCDPES